MSGNPWLDDDSAVQPRNRWADDDEEEFDPDKDPASYFKQVVKRKEIDMVQSTERSLRLIDESEQIGAATGGELLRQGEVLKRTERRVDQMEQDLKESDRHIQSIKSVWGAFLNKFKKAPSQTPVTAYDDDSQPNSRLQKAVSASEATGYQEGDDYGNHPVLARQNESRQQYARSEMQEKNERMKQVDDNLDKMMGGLTRLKALGLGLHDEIEAQDQVINRLGEKVQRVDDKTHSTNKKLIKLNHS